MHALPDAVHVVGGPQGAGRSSAAGRPRPHGNPRPDAFDAGPWGIRYPSIAQSWRRSWEAVVPFLASGPLALRCIIDGRKKPPVEWQAAKARFAIRFGERSIIDQ